MMSSSIIASFLFLSSLLFTTKRSDSLALGPSDMNSTATENTFLLSRDDDEYDDDAKKGVCIHKSSTISWREEFRAQWSIFGPTLSSMLLYKMPWLISLRFVGQLNNPHHLAAAALATTLCNVTGISFSVGLSSALVTLTGQARGNRQLKKKTSQLASSPSKSSGSSYETEINLPLMYLYRGLVVQALFVIPIGCAWLWGVRDLLIILGQTEQLAAQTETYLRILTPGLWGYSVNWTLTAWLQTIEMAYVPAYAAAIGLAFHIPLNYILVYSFQLDYLGCAVATALFQVIQPLFIFGYFFLNSGRNLLKESLEVDSISVFPELRQAISTFEGLKEYLGLAIPGIILISEWWASEVSIFLSGKLQPQPSIALGAMTLYQSINTACFMFPVACSVAGSTRVATLLGASKPVEAQQASRVSIVAAGIVSSCCGAILYGTPHSLFPSLFTDDVELIKNTEKLIPLLAAYVIADGVQSAFTGTIRGIGRQAITIPVVVFSYWIFGLPMAYFLAFVRNAGTTECGSLPSFTCGEVGLVTGMTGGTWLHMLLLGVVVLGMIDWDIEGKRTQDRLDLLAVKQDK